MEVSADIEIPGDTRADAATVATGSTGATGEGDTGVPDPLIAGSSTVPKKRSITASDIEDVLKSLHPEISLTKSAMSHMKKLIETGKKTKKRRGGDGTYQGSRGSSKRSKNDDSNALSFEEITNCYPDQNILDRKYAYIHKLDNLVFYRGALKELVLHSAQLKNVPLLSEKPTHIIMIIGLDEPNAEFLSLYQAGSPYFDSLVSIVVLITYDTFVSNREANELADEQYDSKERNKNVFMSKLNCNPYGDRWQDEELIYSFDLDDGMEENAKEESSKRALVHFYSDKLQKVTVNEDYIMKGLQDRHKTFETTFNLRDVDNGIHAASLETQLEICRKTCLDPSSILLEVGHGDFKMVFALQSLVKSAVATEISSYVCRALRSGLMSAITNKKINSVGMINEELNGWVQREPLAPLSVEEMKRVLSKRVTLGVGFLWLKNDELNQIDTDSEFCRNLENNLKNEYNQKPLFVLPPSSAQSGIPFHQRCKRISLMKSDPMFESWKRYVRENGVIGAVIFKRVLAEQPQMFLKVIHELVHEGVLDDESLVVLDGIPENVPVELQEKNGFQSITIKQNDVFPFHWLINSTNDCKVFRLADISKSSQFRRRTNAAKPENMVYSDDDDDSDASEEEEDDDDDENSDEEAGEDINRAFHEQSVGLVQKAIDKGTILLVCFQRLSDEAFCRLDQDQATRNNETLSSLIRDTAIVKKLESEFPRANFICLGNNRFDEKHHHPSKYHEGNINTMDIKIKEKTAGFPFTVVFWDYVRMIGTYGTNIYKGFCTKTELRKMLKAGVITAETLFILPKCDNDPETFKKFHDSFMLVATLQKENNPLYSVVTEDMCTKYFNAKSNYDELQKLNKAGEFQLFQMSQKTLKHLNIRRSTSMPLLSSSYSASCGSPFDGSIVTRAADQSSSSSVSLCFSCSNDANIEGACDKVCNRCNGNYHRECFGEDSHQCSRCMNEVNQDYLSNDGLLETVNYSISKPWGCGLVDFRTFGVMLVKNVLPTDILCSFHRPLDISITERGRTTDSWNGVTNEFARKGQNREFVQRGHCREDMTMPLAFVTKLDLPEVLKPLTTQLSHVMRNQPKPELRTWNIIHVPPGCDEQELHFDDEECHEDIRYVTILVSLNSIPKESGGTYFEKFGTVQTRPGDALVFTGNLSHKGTANTSNISRYFFYATYSCYPDGNA